MFLGVRDTSILVIIVLRGGGGNPEGKKVSVPRGKGY